MIRDRNDQLALMEEAWYEATKGELFLNAVDAATAEDDALCELLLAMRDLAADFEASMGAPATERELARRVASALHVLQYGGPA